MNINVTLLIQAGNFLLAYFILDRFLLRSAIAVVDHEQEQERSITTRIEHVNERIEQQEQEKEQRWHACRSKFTIPDINKLAGPTEFTYPEQIPYKDPEPIIKHALVKELQSVVAKRIAHAH